MRCEWCESIAPLLPTYPEQIIYRGSLTLLQHQMNHALCKRIFETSWTYGCVYFFPDRDVGPHVGAAAVQPVFDGPQHPDQLHGWEHCWGERGLSAAGYTLYVCLLGRLPRLLCQRLQCVSFTVFSLLYFSVLSVPPKITKLCDAIPDHHWCIPFSVAGKRDILTISFGDAALFILCASQQTSRLIVRE